MIDWIKIGERQPDNANELWEGQRCSPFVPCIVYVCNPDYPKGGVIECARWDVENQKWIDTESWVFYPPFKITHFADKVNIPKN